jgi:crotonobetainyl-CoA:carnitine CoA-transferase CaiB-like acyl-CoA transferase
VTLPLEDTRVLDFGWAMAGPQCTRLLADFGADVIKIESVARPDLARTSFGPHPFGPDAFGLDSSGYFNNFNRNKKSLNLNMQHPGAKEVFRDLLATADVVVENYSAGVLAKWGWTYEAMTAVKPDIIYVSMAGPGHRGPYKSYRTFGPTVQALSGLTYLSGFPGERPAGWGFSYMDHTGGYLAAISVLMALYQRKHHGRGEYIDLSQIEGAITLTGTALLDYQVNGRTSAPVGNRSGHPGAAPHGIYRCQDEYEGRDRWLAIACYTDDQWLAFAEAVEAPGWITDARFASITARLAHQDELDAAIERWTWRRLAHEAMTLLQRAGVPAGVVQNHKDLTERDEQLAHRAMFPTIAHPLLGTYLFDGLPINLSETPGGIRRHGPLFGEHTQEILGDLPGYTTAKVEELVAAGVLR